MKRTDLEKLKGKQILGRMREAGTPGRFGAESAVPSRREQRRLDQQQGLVPFAVKLNGELANRLRTLAQERKVDLNELVAELLQKGLDG